MHKRRKKLSRKQRRMKNRVTIRKAFMLVITLIFNSYAWFLYLTTVSSSLTAHVDAWKVEFMVDDEVVEEEFTINIDHAYPGMSNQNKTVSIVNAGEKSATIDYVIKAVRIFDDQFVATDQIEASDDFGNNYTGMNTTQLSSKIANDYPFSISFSVSDGTIGVGESATLNIIFSWPYESGDDNKDTNYGTESYNRYEADASYIPIEFVIKLIVKQDNS